jgi:amino acid adenylation domain-containing protein
VTFPQALTAAAAIFIHRLTEAEDLVLGQVLTARMTAIDAETPAMMANILPLRLTIRHSTSIRDLAAQAGRQMLVGMTHQRYRLADLRRHLRRVAKPIFGPSVNVLPFLDDLQFAGCPGITCGIFNGPVDDLDVFYQQPKRGAYRVVFNANPELYDAEFLIRVQRRFLRLLETIDDPNKTVGRLDILPSGERRQILVEWNRTNSAYPRDRQVQELVEKQAQRTPDRVAVVCGRLRLTYRELNEQADRIAGQLSLLGVGPEERVGLYAERSLGMLVGLLGILKAGGAYVPLDPNYPQDRLEFIVDDAQPRVLLSQQSLRDEFRAKNANIVSIEDVLCQPAGGERTRSEGNRRSSDLANVIYTSESTGRPKGVQITHRSLVDLLIAMLTEPGISEKDHLLAVTSLSFDMAGFELFLPLIVGAQVTIAPSDVAADGFRLASLMKECGATIMQATPSTWRLLLEAGWDGSKQLKIVCGGEAFSSEFARLLLARCATLWNGYGPTEATVYASVARIEANQRVCLGPPIANTRFYVLDCYGQPVPIGVPGELFIGGDGIARGYLNRPELTIERFLPDPFSGEPGARMYKTGDRVCQLPDRRLEYLGRLDHQVKIRGYRIELGEIESVLRLHSEVRDAAVVARDEGDGNARLIAYVATGISKPVAIDGLRNLLKQKLPAYMMPSAIVALESFPLTPNGKLDRNALPSPNETARDAHEAFVAPRTELEELLALLWRDLLQLKQVGIRDNFFDLGGNSLLMLRLSRKIEQATGQRLPLTVIYDAPTVAGLAEILGGQKSGSGFTPLVLLRPGSEAPPFFFVHGLGGLAMEVVPIARLIRGNHPVYGIQAKGLDGREAPNDRVEAMAEYYLRVITERQPRGPYLLSCLCFGGLVALEIARRLLERGERIGLLALIDTYPHERYWTLPTRFGLLVIRRLKKTWSDLRNLDTWEQVVWHLTRKMRLLITEGWAPWDVDRSLPPAIRAVLEGGIAAIKNYRPRYYPSKVNYLTCEIKNHLVPDNPDCIWSNLVQELAVQSVPGDHAQMISTYAGDVARWLSSLIQDAMDENADVTSHRVLPNAFLVKDGTVFTPAPNGTLLDGITRQRVIGLLNGAGVRVVETTLTYDDPATFKKLPRNADRRADRCYLVPSTKKHGRSIGNSRMRLPRCWNSARSIKEFR